MKHPAAPRFFYPSKMKRETLFGLLRLRIQSAVIPVAGLENSAPTAIIRELHVYGPEVPLKNQSPDAAQHKGLGKALLKEAERIARDEFKAPQMLVLSGVGAKRVLPRRIRLSFRRRLHGKTPLAMIPICLRRIQGKGHNIVSSLSTCGREPRERGNP